jgi:hypothetical protein
MKRFLLLIAGFVMASCSSTQNPSRPSLPPPDFVSVPFLRDTAAVPQGSSVFYAYRFGTREDDWQMTPDWALGNLYHNGVKAAEAWYVRSKRPRSTGSSVSRTIYPPLLVVRLTENDPSITRLRYEQLSSFDPDTLARGLAYPLEHYIPKKR